MRSQTTTVAGISNRHDLRYPRLVDEGGGQLWLKVQVDGIDHEVEIPAGIALSWGPVLWRWLARVIRM